MSLSETCIRRPLLTTLVTASIIVLGVFAYRLLSVAALPAVDFPTIAITATLPGASAETLAASVAAQIELTVDDRRHYLAHLLVVARHHLDHHPIRSQSQHRRRRARRANRAIGGAAPAPGGDDHAAELPEGQSGRFPDPLYQPEFADLAVVGGRRYGEITLARSRSFPASPR
jgi:hypothetical protein